MECDLVVMVDNYLSVIFVWWIVVKVGVENLWSVWIYVLLSYINVILLVIGGDGIELLLSSDFLLSVVFKDYDLVFIIFLLGMYKIMVNLNVIYEGFVFFIEYIMIVEVGWIDMYCVCCWLLLCLVWCLLVLVLVGGYLRLDLIGLIVCF